jgi:predicted enzyme related to lactoylglutathione lyase
VPDPARAGALIYARNLECLSAFYQTLLGMNVLYRDADHHLLGSPDAQLIIHAIPARIADTFEITVPPMLREEQAIKLFFTVSDLDAAQATAQALGGGVCASVQEEPGFRACNAFDPEGNILRLRMQVP